VQPIKSKTLVPDVSQITGIPEADVKLVIDIYYDSIRNCLTELRENRIQVPNLGTFFAKHWLFEKYIEKYERKKDHYYENAQQKYVIVQEAAARIALITNLKQMRDEELQRKEFVNLHKKTYEKDRQDLEEQKEDN
jgi:hypothetical protein